jgi:hypothetical protein
MEAINLIPTADVCRFHEVDDNFISLLNEAGLILFEEINKTTFIPGDELGKLERMIRLNRELEINVAGIEAINYLLDRIDKMQEEIRVLKNRVSAY